MVRVVFFLWKLLKRLDSAMKIEAASRPLLKVRDPGGLTL